MYKTKKCTYCGKDINEQLLICPFCGCETSHGKTILSPTCPRCKIPLELVVEDGEEYDVCPQCGGIWLDKDEFRRATRESTVYRKSTFQGKFVRSLLPDTVTYIPCVRCGKIMNRKNFARISGVIIDECNRHGIWLDAGELEKIQHFIADGGLEKAQNKEIEKNRLKIEELSSRVDQTTFMLKILHFWDIKRWLFGP